MAASTPERCLGGWNVAMDVAALLPQQQAEAMAQKGVAPSQRQVEQLLAAAPQKKTCRAVVVGLDGAGKTSVIGALRTGRAADHVPPTQGCNKSALYRDDVSGRWTPEAGDHSSFGMELLDLGGAAPLRQFWPQLAQNCHAIFAVVDGTDEEQSRWDSFAADLQTLRLSPLTMLASAPLALLVNCRGAAEAACVSPGEALQRLRLGGGDAAVGCRVLGLSVQSSGDTGRTTAMLEWTWSLLAPEQVRHGLQLPDAPRATAVHTRLRLLQVLSEAADQQTRSSSAEEIMTIQEEQAGRTGEDGGGGEGGGGGGDVVMHEHAPATADAASTTTRTLRPSGSTLHCGVKSLRELSRQGQ